MECINLNSQNREWNQKYSWLFVFSYIKASVLLLCNVQNITVCFSSLYPYMIKVCINLHTLSLVEEMKYDWRKTVESKSLIPNIKKKLSCNRACTPSCISISDDFSLCPLVAIHYFAHEDYRLFLKIQDLILNSPQWHFFSPVLNQNSFQQILKFPEVKHWGKCRQTNINFVWRCKFLTTPVSNQSKWFIFWKF